MSRKKADSESTAWVNSQVGSPKIEGLLEISHSKYGIFIGGNPDTLRSLARLLNWLADVDQESRSAIPEGERSHVHLEPGDPLKLWAALTPFSENTEICRLDAKGTGEFPKRYHKIIKQLRIKYEKNKKTKERTNK